MAKIEESQLIEDEGFDRKDDHYENLHRENGVGPCRLNKVISDDTRGGLREDLYSLIFASTYRAEYVVHYRKEEDKKETLKDALR